jgi:hypothetical protein
VLDGLDARRDIRAGPSEETPLGESQRLRTSGMLTTRVDCARPRFSDGAFTWREDGWGAGCSGIGVLAAGANREMRLKKVSRAVSSALLSDAEEKSAALLFFRSSRNPSITSALRRAATTSNGRSRIEAS